MKTWITTIGALFLSVTPALAQQATSFEQLQVLVRPGDTITVTDQEGHFTQGKVRSIDASTLKIASRNDLQQFTQNQVLQITQRRSDSLGNGASAGALTGGLIGALPVIASCRERYGCNAGIGAAYIGMFAGMGAGVGVLIDALVTHRETVFHAPRTSALRRFDLKPLVSKDKKGAAVVFSF